MQRSHYVTLLIIKSQASLMLNMYTQTHSQQENEELSFVTYSLLLEGAIVGLFLYFYY